MGGLVALATKEGDMATVEDIVSALVQQTKEGKIQWEIIGRNDAGVPRNWRTSTHECQFETSDDHGLSVYFGDGHGSHPLATAIEIAGLLDLMPEDSDPPANYGVLLANRTRVLGA